MPSRARLDEFIAAVVSGDHAGAIERFYTEDASMQENAAPPRVGRDVLVAHERAVLEKVERVTSTCVASVVEGDQVAIHWVFDFVFKSGKTARFDEVALQQWRRPGVARAVLLRYGQTRVLMTPADSSLRAEAIGTRLCYFLRHGRA